MGLSSTNRKLLVPSVEGDSFDTSVGAFAVEARVGGPGRFIDSVLGPDSVGPSFGTLIPVVPPLEDLAESSGCWSEDSPSTFVGISGDRACKSPHRRKAI